MAKERRPVNQLKKIYRKLAHDPKIPAHLRVICAHCLARLDNLIEIEFFQAVLTKKAGNSAGQSKKQEDEPEEIEAPVDMDAILSNMREK
jgi:hypothetical protein